MAQIAVVDIGSNSTRLLIAEVAGGSVAALVRRSHVTRLGEGVDASGRLSQGAMERVFGVLSEYRAAIDRLGVERVCAIATSAVRDSGNGDRFRRELSDRFGLDARVLSGDEEARLTFLGATTARGAGATPVLVIDIGGGSTELVVGPPAQAPSFHVSTRAGSVRQSERHLHDDPPREDQVEALMLEVRAIFEQSVPAAVRTAAPAGIAVAGTATALAAIDQHLDPYDPQRVDGHELGADACEALLRRLAALPLAERREVKGLHPRRAPTIVAGAAILVEALRAFGLDGVTVSEADILEGAALEARGVTAMGSNWT